MGSEIAVAKNSAMTLLLGDNFYSSGITTPSRFEPGFENAFSQSAFSSMPFYAIAGNHDHLGNVHVQIEYHKQGSGRWNFPDYDYTIDKSLTMEHCVLQMVLRICKQLPSLGAN